MGYVHIASYEPKSIDEVNKVVLLYSGGLDTSVMLKWIQDKYKAQVIALCIDIGQQIDDLEAIQKKAIKLGAIKSLMVDAKDDFADNYIARGIKANASYQGNYHLSTPMGRPLLAKLAVDVARKEKADTLAHGCTGKGNDQVRIEGTAIALDPNIKIIAPVREWGMGRDEEIEYARANNIPVPHTVDKPYSSDDNMWGVTCEGGDIENPELIPDMKSFLQVCVHPSESSLEEDFVNLEFCKGIPVALNGVPMKLSEIIIKLNKIGAQHSIGLVHHMEDRVVGLKVRGVYEQPAAHLIIKAHKQLEKYVCTRNENKFKELVDQEWAYMCYAGFWYEPLMKDLNAFTDSVNEKVNGLVTLRLYRCSADVVALKTPDGLFDKKLATFMKDDTFNQNASPGFIEIFTLQMKMSKMTTKNILVTVGGEENKEKLLSSIKKLHDVGCKIFATQKTSAFLERNNIDNQFVYKISESGKPNIKQLLWQKFFDLVINIPSPKDNNGQQKTDGEQIRDLAIHRNVSLITDLGVVESTTDKLVNSIKNKTV